MGKGIYDTLKDYYMSNYTKLCSYVAVYTKNNRLAGDLVHDAFLRVMERYIDPPDTERYRKIIARILRNSIVTYFRETKRTIPTDKDFFENIEISMEKYDPGKKECMEKMTGFFKELENPGKLILYLNLYEGFSLANIARMTGLRQRNVYFWKNKALGIMKDKMTEAGCGDV